MKDPLIKGHPLHALLTDLPIGMLAGGTACDLLGFATRRHTWRFAARAMHTGAVCQRRRGRAGWPLGLSGRPTRAPRPPHRCDPRLPQRLDARSAAGEFA